LRFAAVCVLLASHNLLIYSLFLGMSTPF